MPSRPLNMAAIEPTNRGLVDLRGRCSRRRLGNGHRCGSAGGASARGVRLDVREPGEYQRGHVAGAVNIPQAELVSRLDELPREQPILIICQTGSRSRRAAQFLMQIGFTDVANVLGGSSAWRRAGKPLVRGEGVSEPAGTS